MKQTKIQTHKPLASSKLSRVGMKSPVGKKWLKKGSFCIVNEFNHNSIEKSTSINMQHVLKDHYYLPDVNSLNNYIPAWMLVFL